MSNGGEPKSKGLQPLVDPEGEPTIVRPDCEALAEASAERSEPVTEFVWSKAIYEARKLARQYGNNLDAD